VGAFRAGAFNTVTSTIFLMLLLSAGLYYVALNPSTGGFSVEAASFGTKTTRQAQADDYFKPRAQLVDGRQATANVTSNARPACQEWYKTRRGDTQWGLAQRHSDLKNKWPWIKGMRWVSGKSAKDDSLKSGEVVCIEWSS
jgi:hypothetical protein